MTLLLTLLLFLAVAIGFPLGVIVLAIAWPWIVVRLARDGSPRHLLHGIAMSAGTAAGLFLRQSVLVLEDTLLGGGILWFIVITVGVIAYGLSTIALGVVSQSRRERGRTP